MGVCNKSCLHNTVMVNEPHLYCKILQHHLYFTLQGIFNHTYSYDVFLPCLTCTHQQQFRVQYISQRHFYTWMRWDEIRIKPLSVDSPCLATDKWQRTVMAEFQRWPSSVVKQNRSLRRLIQQWKYGRFLNESLFCFLSHFLSYKIVHIILAFLSAWEKSFSAKTKPIHKDTKHEPDVQGRWILWTLRHSDDTFFFSPTVSPF